MLLVSRLEDLEIGLDIHNLLQMFRSSTQKRVQQKS